MMPLWLFTLGKKLLESNANLKIPFGNLATSLVTLTLPIVIGIIIRQVVTHTHTHTPRKAGKHAYKSIQLHK